MPPQEIVLITGANGYVGYATIVRALQAGYKVRGTVRRQDAADYVRSRGKSIEEFKKSGALELIILSDIGDKETFVKAASGCTYIIHIAFAFPSTPGDLHKIAMSGLNAMLYAAEQIPSIKRIVWTSSIAGIADPAHIHYDNPTIAKLLTGSPEADSIPTLTSDSSVQLPRRIDKTSCPFSWYQYGKIAATNALREYATTKSPKFGIVILLPGWTLGPNELCKTKQEAFDLKGTNSFLLFLYQEHNYNVPTGRAPGDEAYIPAAFVHLDDVSEGHVNALKVPIGQDKRLRNFLMCSDGESGPRVDSAIEIVRENFPSEAGKLYEKARYGTIPCKLDCLDTEAYLLGHPLKTYETAVKDTIGWYSTLP